MSRFQMIDVGDKAHTRRRALAEGFAKLSPEAYRALREKTNPKGDVLALAEAAGITATKKTSELIPLCHPLFLEAVRLSFEPRDESCEIRVLCEARTTGQTGVEMEALTGATAALLTIYDLSKAVHPEITLSGIRLLEKEGGKSGLWRHSDAPATPQPQPQSQSQSRLENLRAAVLTISDRVSRGESVDTSGPELVRLLREMGAEVREPRVVSDDLERIQQATLDAIHEGEARLLLTTGGTGLSPRDVTPEALAKIAERTIDGFGELLRRSGASQTPMAWLSRSNAYVIRGCLVISLPGSPRAVREGWEAVSSLIPHALHTLAGGQHA